MTPNQEARTATVDRQTSETSIRAELNLDGAGQSRIHTSIPFLDHMLIALTKHGHFDLAVEAQGDTQIDDHHTVEDIGIVLGMALHQALGSKAGITRFGWATVPLDEALVQVVVDLSGRPYLVYNVPLANVSVKTFDVGLFEDFFQAFVTHGGFNLHINVQYGRNPHHIMEAAFKALARALAQAVAPNARSVDIPSTKGTLE